MTGVLPKKGVRRALIDAPDIAALSDKVAHVMRAGQTRDHHCHWPGCGKQVPPARWGCLTHWRALPKRLRDRIWATYRPGQESDLNPSAAYLSVARDVQAWIARKEKRT